MLDFENKSGISGFLYPYPVEVVGECWVPVGGPTTAGRPAVNIMNNHWIGARWSYCHNVAKIPISPPNMKEGLILHTCDNALCVRPDHLYLGSQKDNIRDIRKRFTGIHASKGGEKHPMFGGRIKHSEEAKKKMSAAKIGKPKSESHKKAISDAMKLRNAKKKAAE